MKKDYVVVIGAANIDVQGLSFNKLVMEDSNPGKIVISSGGVGRNIAENLARMGSEVKLVTAVGTDPYSTKMLEECRQCGIDTSASLVIDGMSSPMYLSILDDNGDMKLALCDNHILDSLDCNFLKERHNILQEAALLLLDTNLPDSVLKYVADTYSDKMLFIDTVSTKKALKIKDFVGCFNTIKVNLIEAQALSDLTISKLEELPQLAAFFSGKGVKNIFITLGENGVYYSMDGVSGYKPTPKISVTNATGAGDAFMAGLIHARLNGYEPDKTASFAMGASILALQHENTINPGMSEEKINHLLKELELC